MQLLLLLAMLLASSGEIANAADPGSAIQPHAAYSAAAALSAPAATASDDTSASVIPFVTEGSSMSPSIESGDHLSVDTVYYQNHPLHRGDIVVFRAPDERAFVKRIVGLPGETIRLDRTALFVNRKRSTEMTLKGCATVTDNIGLGKDELYVLGDNCAHSYDSRYIGPVRIGSIIGKVTKIDRKTEHPIKAAAKKPRQP